MLPFNQGAITGIILKIGLITMSLFHFSMVASAPIVYDDDPNEDGGEVDIVDDDGSGKAIGILFFKKWSEDQPNFTEECLDYLMEMDSEKMIDYGRVLRSDVSDMDELTLLRKISNFSQAVNNALFDTGVRPPFYYLAVPLRKGAPGQEICDRMKLSFNLDSIFFTYPPI